MFPLRTNFALCIAGPSGSGKTALCVKMLNNADVFFDKKFAKITWILGNVNAKPKGMKKSVEQDVEFVDEMPQEFVNDTAGESVLYILDDSMFEAQNKNVANLLTKGRHHQGISVIYVTQNLFHQSKYARDISLNFTHLCCMNNPRDRSQILYLARQLFPENPKELVRVYKAITNTPYGYLFIDLTQDTHNLLRFRTDIFNPNYLTVFCTKPEANGDEIIENEDCEKEQAYSLCLKRCQV